MSNSIEPPRVIANKRDGLQVIAETINGVVQAERFASGRPCVGLLYLRFSTEEEADEWMKSFKTLLNHKWRNDLGKPEDICLSCVSKENDRNTIDVFFAPTKALIQECVRMRFPDL